MHSECHESLPPTPIYELCLWFPFYFSCLCSCWVTEFPFPPLLPPAVVLYLSASPCANTSFAESPGCFLFIGTGLTMFSLWPSFCVLQGRSVTLVMFRDAPGSSHALMHSVDTRRRTLGNDPTAAPSATGLFPGWITSSSMKASTDDFPQGLGTPVVSHKKTAQLREPPHQGSAPHYCTQQDCLQETCQ